MCVFSVTKASGAVGLYVHTQAIIPEFICCDYTTIYNVYVLWMLMLCAHAPGYRYKTFPHIVLCDNMYRIYSLTSCQYGIYKSAHVYKLRISTQASIFYMAQSCGWYTCGSRVFLRWGSQDHTVLTPHNTQISSDTAAPPAMLSFSLVLQKNKMITTRDQTGYSFLKQPMSVQ